MPDCTPSSFPASSRKLVRASIKKASVFHTAAQQVLRHYHGGATRLGFNKKTRKRVTHLGQDTSALFDLLLHPEQASRKTHVLCRTAPRHTATSPLFENDAGHFISVGSRSLHAAPRNVATLQPRALPLLCRREKVSHGAMRSQCVHIKLHRPHSPWEECPIRPAPRHAVFTWAAASFPSRNVLGTM